jgi:tetratricopeptide (TPR) repeat protein
MVDSNLLKKTHCRGTLILDLLILLFMANPIPVYAFVEDAYDRGMKYALQGQFREAKSEFKKGLELDPDYQPLKQSLKIAEDVISQKIKKETAVHLFRSADYANRGFLDESIAEDEKAIAIDPGYVIAYNSLGASYIEKSQMDKAVSCLDKAIELDSTFYESYVLRGLARAYQKQYDSAVSDYNKAIAINPKDPGVFYNRALVYFLMGNYRGAAKDARQAKALGFEVPEKFIEDIRRSLANQL